MVRINKEEIKGITDDRKKSSCAAVSDNNAAKKEEETGGFCPDGYECHIDWHED